ncbi:MAG: hydrogenase maturation nickel metallochaperone HypA [Nitrospirae bacterium]|nr:hydrogenase maturation nickel metallochaperone HypA [Nitrospirota bacterium]
MHELSIAQSILDTAVAECLGADFKRINSILLRVGKSSGVNVSSLLSAFEIIKVDTIADGAVLVCEEVPVRGRCFDCHNDFTADSMLIPSCPVCSGTRFRIHGGRELDIVEIDVD